MNNQNILKDIVLGHQTVSYEEFEEYMINFIEGCMKEIGVTFCEPECIIEDLSEMKILGAADSYKTVILDKKLLKELYNGKRLNLQIILHELAHIAQNLMIYAGDDSQMTIDIIKEKCLNEFQESENKRILGDDIQKSYYHANYEVSILEANADKNSIELLIGYFRKINLEFTLEEKSILGLQIKMADSALKNRRRYMGGCVTINDYYLTLDEAFEFALQYNPQWLKEYPQLKKVYGSNLTRKLEQ